MAQRGHFRNEVLVFAAGAARNLRAIAERHLETGRHAATFAGGTPGAFQGSYSYLLQDDDGQTADVHSVSAGLDYPGVGPEHSYWKDTGRVRYTYCRDDQALAAFDFCGQQLAELDVQLEAQLQSLRLSEDEPEKGKKRSTARNAPQSASRTAQTAPSSSANSSAAGSGGSPARPCCRCTNWAASPTTGPTPCRPDSRPNWW